jgi:hypothetical protein
LPPGASLRADLTAPRFEITPNGLLIEDKADIVKRIGRSPDEGDAVVISWSEGQEALGRGLSGPNSGRRAVHNLQTMSINPGKGRTSAAMTGNDYFSGGHGGTPGGGSYSHPGYGSHRYNRGGRRAEGGYNPDTHYASGAKKNSGEGEFG